MFRINQRAILGVSLMVMAFGLIACTNGVSIRILLSPSSNTELSAIIDESLVESPTISPDESLTESQADGRISAGQAADIAVQTIVDGAVISIELGREHGRNVWEVLVRQPDGNGIELYIATDNGEIVDQESAWIPREARDAAPTVSAQQAIGIALEAVPGTVTELDLGTERRRTVWEVIVRSTGIRGVEFYIDASTGEILKQESFLGSS